MIFTLLQTQPAAGSSAGMWLMIILLFLVMWLFMIRPQRKQQKALEEMRRNLKKGDKVLAGGCIYGVIVDIDERTVLVKVDGETKLRVAKEAITLDPGTPAADPAPEKPEKPKKNKKSGTEE